MFYTKQEIIVELREIEHYGKRCTQKTIADNIRHDCRNSFLSHEAVIDEMSHAFARPNLKVYIPLRGDIKGRQKYYVGEVLIYRRWLSYLLQTGTDGFPKHPPRLLENVRQLHLYQLIKAQLGRK